MSKADETRQHIIEKAYYETPGQGYTETDPNAPSTPEQLEPPPVPSRLAGPSRLVFAVPDNQSAIPYTLEAVLEACSSFPLKVPRTALPPDPPPS